MKINLVNVPGLRRVSHRRQLPMRTKNQLGNLVVDSLFIVAPIICWGFMFGPCFVMQYLVSLISNFAIISLGKSELVALLLLSSC